jgi:hypothetical protein
MQSFSLSTIYRLGTNKKAPAAADAFLEELAGTAPASAGLSWLVFYRFSLFCSSCEVLAPGVFKQTNISGEQF